MKIFLAVPTFENIYPDTFKSIYGLNRGDHWVVFDFVRGYDCATARNHIAQQALDEQADYVLMVDNDVTLPADALLNMLEDPKEVCLGYYPHRSNNGEYTGHTCVCRLYDNGGKEYFHYPLDSEYTAEDMRKFRSAGIHKVRIHGGGMGCALIRTDVFRKIQYPWYDWVNYSDNNRGMLSEDLYFCERCKSAGIPIFTDTRVACGHMFRYVQEVV